MISKEYTILAPEGFHARPAKALLKLLRQYDSKVKLFKGDIEADANSMLGILSMQAQYNSAIRVEISGSDENAVAERLDVFFEEEVVKL